MAELLPASGRKRRRDESRKVSKSHHAADDTYANYVANKLVEMLREDGGEQYAQLSNQLLSSVRHR